MLLCWLTSLILHQLCSSLFFPLVYQTPTVSVLIPLHLSGHYYIYSLAAATLNSNGVDISV